MPQSSSSSQRSRSVRLRYRTVAPTSQVDETLFGTPTVQSPCDPKQPKTLRNSGPRARNVSAQKTEKEETVRIITNDHIRDLKIPSDPSGLSVILPQNEYKRITAASHVTTKEDRQSEREVLQMKKVAAMDAAEERKVLLRKADLRNKSQARSIIDEEARDQAQYLLARANAMRMEQEEEVQKLNGLILAAHCQAVRDAQILEKKQVEMELKDEEKRLQDMMDLDRCRAQETQDQTEEQRKQMRTQYKQQIMNQIEERLKERLLQDELREQEGQQLLEKLERMELEELRSLEMKRQDQDHLHEENMRINDESKRIKEQRQEEERMADIRSMEYTKKKMEREAAYEAEQKRIKREKEKELVRMRALLERDRDHKAEKDELRARRNQEAADREWRKKEKEQVEKKTEETALLRATLAQQVVQKEQLLSIEAGRKRAEFERVLKAQEEALIKQKEEEERKHQRALHHTASVREQVRERELIAVANRRELFQEGERLAEKELQRRARLDEIKEKKLKELKAAGLPEKYCNQLERKISTLTHHK